MDLDYLELTSPPTTQATATVGPDAHTTRLPRIRLIRDHRCSVAFPDGTEGTCLYERLGPAYHRFDYRYADGSHLPRQYWTHPLLNDYETIEEATRARAEDAFMEGIEVERKDYFARASEPTSGARKTDPTKFQMSAKRAKELGGKYALCTHVGRRLVPVSVIVDTFAHAKRIWMDCQQPEFLICACNRLDRCWELLKLNPLKAVGHPTREAQNV